MNILHSCSVGLSTRLITLLSFQSTLQVFHLHTTPLVPRSLAQTMPLEVLHPMSSKFLFQPFLPMSIRSLHNYVAPATGLARAVVSPRNSLVFVKISSAKCSGSIVISTGLTSLIHSIISIFRSIWTVALVTSFLLPPRSICWSLKNWSQCNHWLTYGLLMVPSLRSRRLMLVQICRLDRSW